MRKHKTIKIDDHEITVKELRVKDIMELFGTTQDTSDILAKAEYFLPRCTEGITMDGLKAMAPSEIKTIYDAFVEVNQVFFDLAQEMGLANVMTELKVAIRKEFSEALADSLKQVTPTPLNTVTGISS